MSEPTYSAKQEQGGTAVGMTGAEMPSESPSAAMPATPDRDGAVGPPAQTQWPWPGRAEQSEVAFDGSAAAFAVLAAQAQRAPGQPVTSSETAGAPNTGPME